MSFVDSKMVRKMMRTRMWMKMVLWAKTRETEAMEVAKMIMMVLLDRSAPHRATRHQREPSAVAQD